MSIRICEPQDHRSTAEIFRDQERNTRLPYSMNLHEQYISDKVDREIKELLERQRIAHEKPKRCQLCGDVLINTELNDHDIERGVCHSCYAMEVTAGDTW